MNWSLLTYIFWIEFLREFIKAYGSQWVKGKVLFLGPGGQSPSFENDFDVFKLVFVCLGSKSLRYVFIGIYNSMYDLRSFYKRK